MKGRLRNKMGSTYWITGTQIGIIYAMLDLGNSQKVRELLQEILDNQLTTKEARAVKKK